MKPVICAIWAILLGGMSACTTVPAPAPLPEPFGVTMVEETTCNGLGGRIVMGSDGGFCSMDP
ncbi:hypothetical protein L0666_06335 [Octadecabacter sp. CECT 8868]|uniref:hypothetical protein n=1 Tax=Octadecabacter algicola TaxID=2909342 RepID=UPI001F47BAC8|nr:hypothetical protein [Octadecabacter algicola]MCF2904598.1 hypothetical protein [Octadecabacter algicola]